MSLNILVTICLLACAFYLYVLSQWVRDSDRRGAARRAVGEAGTRSEKKRLQIVAFPRAAEGQDRGRVKSHHAASKTEALRDRGAGCAVCERVAYERIAASVTPD